MKKYFALLIALLLISSGQASAWDWFGGRLSAGGGYGYAEPKLPNSFHANYDSGRMWSAHLKYFLNNDFSIVASYADMHIRNKNSPDDIHFRPLIGSFRYNIFHHLPISPYITGGVGVGFNRMELPGGEAMKWEKLSAQGGLGFEFFINENTSLGAEALYHHFEAPKGVRPYRPISAIGTVNLYFGEGPDKRRIREDAEQSKRIAEEAQRQAAAAQQQALTAQQQANTSMQAQNSAQQQASAAQQAAAAAEAARQQAEQNAQQAQAQVQQAQAEADQLKQMVARKEIQPVTFETGSATLRSESNSILDKVAEIAKKYPNLKLRVEGHTDSQGTDSFNQQLSQKRAESVQTYLSGQGVPTEQISAVGFGETRPVASNDTADGRSKNRRVEFIFSL